jgi:VanZ family protein
MKVLHLVEYGVLAALWIWGLRHGTDWPPRHVVVAAAVLTFLWGVSDETHQSFVPGRTARVTDAIADLVAALAVVTAWYRYRNTDRSPDAIRRRK